MSSAGARTRPASATDVAAALEHVGLRGVAVAAHSSLSAFGRVDGGADAIVDALTETCPTVLAPAFCFEPNWTPPPDDRPERNGCDYAFYDDWSREAAPWDVETAPIDASMGVVPRTLAQRTGTRRSDNPWHSWLAWGRNADALVAAHRWDEPNAPLARLAERGGHVVLLGVGLSSCTAVHLAEERAGRRPFIRWMLDRDGQVRRIRVGGCSKGFDRLWPHCADLFAEEPVGETTVRAAPLEPLLDRLAGVIRERPQVTVCSTECIRCRDAALGGPLE